MKTDIALERGMPVNLDAERFVLGAALTDPEAMADLRSALESDDFSIEKHRRIWAACCDVFDAGRPVERISLVDELMRRGQLESVDGMGYIVDLDDGLRIVNVGSYVAVLKDKAMLRHVIRSCDALQRLCFEGDSAAHVSEAAGRMWANFTEPEKARGFLTPMQVFEQYGVQAILEPKREQGIRVPWPWLDKMLCGLQPEQLVILAGHTSNGKTSAALQIATRAALDGKRVAIFSLEMSTPSLIRRLVTQMSRVDAQFARHGALKPEERARQQAAAERLLELPIWIDDSAARTTATVHAALRKLVAKSGTPDLVIVDHLHILKGSGKFESRNKEVAENARTLKLLGKEFRTCMLVPAQLNRKSAEDNRQPTTTDLRESGEIEENADVVIFTHLEAKEGDNPARKGKLIIGKQREGPRHVDRSMVFFENIQCFEEVDTTYAN